MYFLLQYFSFLKIISFLKNISLGQTLRTVNCIDTWEGVYQFTYEVSWGGGGICDAPDSRIKACQDPGSAYVDNQVFLMTYARCPGVQTSKSESESSGEVTFGTDIQFVPLILGEWCDKEINFYFSMTINTFKEVLSIWSCMHI